MEVLIQGNPFTLTWTKSTSAKRGRQGYALFLVEHESGLWHWFIETQNGDSVASSEKYYVRKWDAKRAALRLTDRIKHVYTEDVNGVRVREM